MENHNDKQLSSMYSRFGKRFLDIVLSGGAIIVLSPALATLAVLVRVKHGRPIFFTPTRPGKDERIFRLYKFRTMTNDRDKDGVLLPESERLTKLGKFLRATSLDEIPELFNIFKGDMSIVGPRPFAMKNLPFYSEEERTRHTVRPGLTGLAQISGRNNLMWPERFAKDLEYISQQSLKNDLLIVMGTVSKVFGDSDVVIPDSERMPQFDMYRVLQEEATIPEPQGHTGMREVGSFYWIEGGESDSINTQKKQWLPLLGDSSYTFSGRAAIQLALLNAMKEKRIKSAYVPSYLPFAALQPFIQMNIQYEFYDVDYKNGQIKYRINQNKKCDLFFIVDYFGMKSIEMSAYADHFKKRGSIVVQDVTHSLLNEWTGYAAADYLVASIRKWIAAPSGGWITKREGQLSIKPNLDGDEAAESMKSAMLTKHEYINGKTNDKTSFLKQYVNFESSLVQLSPMLQIDSRSKEIVQTANIGKIKTKREENALFLYDRLSNNEKIHFFHTRELLEECTPIYLPILISKSQRTSLRNFLIERGFYCPIHWPERMGAATGFRENELSLPCDQRYSCAEMNDLANAIEAWCREQECEK